jgi:hypothetical protein
MRALRAQEGITLVMAVGILGCFSLTGTALIYYSSATMRSAAYSGDNSNAYSLAEAGLNEVMAVLSRPENNALNKYLLGYQPNGTIVKTTSSYNEGTVTWWGILNEGTATWSVTSIGETKNPSGASATPIRRTLTAKVPVTPTLTQPLNSPAWNYIYATRTGNTCDLTLSQSVQVGSPLYVNGNLCLQNTASITNGPLVVRGQLTLSQSANAVGSSASPINEAHIANGCQWKNNVLHLPCSSLDNVFARARFKPDPDRGPCRRLGRLVSKREPGPLLPLLCPERHRACLRQRPGLARKPRPDEAKLQRPWLLQPHPGHLLHLPDSRRGALLERGHPRPHRARDDLHRRERAGAKRSRQFV